MKAFFFYNYALTFLFFSLIFVRCTDRENISHNQEKKTIKEYYNIILLIDLSSHRMAIKGQKDRDLELIKHIIQLFENRQSKFGYISSKDKIHILPTPSINLNSNFSYTIDMAGKNKPKFDNEKKRLFTTIDALYTKAKISPLSSDIWTFVNYNLPNYISSSSKNETFKNKLIVLSNGYMSFNEDITRERARNTFISEKDLDRLRNKDKNQWLHIFANESMKLKPCENTNPEGLDALVLEVTPKKPDIYTNEFEILEKIWLTWLNESSITAKIYIRDVSLDMTKKNIVSFLSSENKSGTSKKIGYEYFKLSKLQNPEVVKGYRGEYFMIDVYSSDKIKKKLFFKPGQYIIDDFSKYSLALAEFGESIYSRVKKSNIDFQIFTLGSADFQGNDTFKGQLLQNYYYDRICFYPKFNEAKMYFSPKEKCTNMAISFKNNDLPLLRACFLKEKFDEFYSATMKPALILEGGVTLSVSDKERNGLFILYLNKPNFL